MKTSREKNVQRPGRQTDSTKRRVAGTLTFISRPSGNEYEPATAVSYHRTGKVSVRVISVQFKYYQVLLKGTESNIGKKNLTGTKEARIGG